MKLSHKIVLTACGGAAIGSAGALALASGSPVPARRMSTPDRCTMSAVAGIFANEAGTRVLAVHAFAKGDRLGKSGKDRPVAVADLCMVKLVVGPGTPGPAGAPSTQAGIGIEVWLPSPSDWTGRIHNVGGAAFMGLPEITNPEEIAPGVSGIEAASAIAGHEGAVSAITDTGHAMEESDNDAYSDGSFLLRPDGAINTEQWTDFSERGIHEAAIKTRQLTQAYYGRPASHAYFEGCSTGGRQAHKYAERFPADYDGIVAGAPGINWSRFLTSDLSLQVVMQRALGGPIDPAKLRRISSAAVSACDAGLTGRHDGYISDPTTCGYDPTKDKALLCRADGGGNVAGDCVSKAEARTVNAMWFGQTDHGTSPDPAQLAGLSDRLEPGQYWFGPMRGADLSAMAGSSAGKGVPFPPSAHMVAFALGRNEIASPNLRNAAGNGADRWRDLSFAELARASQRGRELQDAYARIDTDDTDLTPFRSRGGKMIVYHGLADQIVPAQGSFHYYRALERTMKGQAAVDSFYRLFPVPGYGHCGGVGTVDGVAGVSPKADPPRPRSGQFYEALVSWVEGGQAPDQLVVRNDHDAARPLCRFPSKLHYTGGDVRKAASFSCA